MFHSRDNALLLENMREAIIWHFRGKEGEDGNKAQRYIMMLTLLISLVPNSAFCWTSTLQTSFAMVGARLSRFYSVIQHIFAACSMNYHWII